MSCQWGLSEELHSVPAHYRDMQMGLHAMFWIHVTRPITPGRKEDDSITQEWNPTTLPGSFVQSENWGTQAAAKCLLSSTPMQPHRGNGCTGCPPCQNGTTSKFHCIDLDNTTAWSRRQQQYLIDVQYEHWIFAAHHVLDTSRKSTYYRSLHLTPVCTGRQGRVACRKDHVANQYCLQHRQSRRHYRRK